MQPRHNIKIKPIFPSIRRSIPLRLPATPGIMPVGHATPPSKSKPIIHRIRQVPNTRQRMITRSSAPAPTPLFSAPNPAIDRIHGVGIGRILIIVGNGPSHREIPLEQLLDHDKIDLMSINRPDDRLWPTKYWLFCDGSQLTRHSDLWDKYEGIIINSSGIRKHKPSTVTIHTLNGKGFSLDLHKGIHIGKSSVYAAMQVSLWMGYDHIYIFGCDMAAVNGKLYAWGSNPDVDDASRLRRFDLEAENYQWMVNNVKTDLLDRFTFCSDYNRYKFIESFERLGQSTAVETILSRYQTGSPGSSA